MELLSGKIACLLKCVYSVTRDFQYEIRQFFVRDDSGSRQGVGSENLQNLFHFMILWNAIQLHLMETN